VADRAKAALLGALLADAATMPLHWHYDQVRRWRSAARIRSARAAQRCVPAQAHRTTGLDAACC
jgi:hypothetical protein